MEGGFELGRPQTGRQEHWDGQWGRLESEREAQARLRADAERRTHSVHTSHRSVLEGMPGVTAGLRGSPPSLLEPPWDSHGSPPHRASCLWPLPPPPPGSPSWPEVYPSWAPGCTESFGQPRRCLVTLRVPTPSLATLTAVPGPDTSGKPAPAVSNSLQTPNASASPPPLFPPLKRPSCLRVVSSYPPFKTLLRWNEPRVPQP